jgi:hypothetical protein
MRNFSDESPITGYQVRELHKNIGAPKKVLREMGVFRNGYGTFGF